MSPDAAAVTQTLVTAWWLFFWTALGLCIGSFLNVVIYRLPRGRSLRSPLWSACPACRHRIAWYDNIPVISFILLGGRCRKCAVPISTRYPVVEMAGALIVLLLLDAFMVSHVRAGLRDTQFGLTERLSYDWPILVAHVILFSCLLAMSAIDLEHYWVDIRFTNLVTAAGFVLHMIWTPRHSSAWPRPMDATAVVCACALVGLVLAWLVIACQPEPELEQDSADVESDASPTAITSKSPPPSLRAGSRRAAWAAGAALLTMLVLLFVDETQASQLRHTGRALMVLAFLWALIAAESIVPRISDHAIVEAIYDERHESRRMVLVELGVLAPAIVLGLVGLALMQVVPELPARVAAALSKPIFTGPPFEFRHWTPLAGFATAATGFVLAGALGWAIRIVFTLAFGKEAFGAGDIHMMAAAGAVAGWPVVLLGFFLTCLLALMGWVTSLPFKRTRAVPLGPWLSLAFLAVVVFYDELIRWPVIARAIEVFGWLFLDGNSIAPRLAHP